MNKSLNMSHHVTYEEIDNKSFESQFEKKEQKHFCQNL